MNPPLMKKSKESIQQGILISLFTIIIMFLLAEGFFRFLDSRRDMKFNFVSQVGRKIGLFQYDTDLGWKNVADFESESRWPDGRWAVEKINSQGLRDREYSIVKPENTYRIAVIGCSRIYGYGVYAEETYPKALEEMLTGKAGKTDIEVINFGVNGYGLTQMALNYTLNVRKYNPDLVIIQYYRPSIFRVSQTEMWASQKPAFILSNGDLVLKNHPVPYNRFRSIEYGWMKHSVFYRFIKDKLLKIAHARKQKRKENIDEDKELHRICTEIFRFLKKNTDEDNAQLIAFTWGEDADWLLPICEKGEVDVFILEQWENPEPWTERGDIENPPPTGHWSPLGHKYVATSIYTYLKQKKLTPVYN